MASNVGAVSHAPWGEYVARVGRMTVEQFAQFPAEDGWMYELHEGRLIAMPGPGYDHGAIQARIIMLLGSYMLDHGLGILAGTCCYNLPLPNNTEELLCPDLSYVEPARKTATPLRGSYLVGAPDFVIEIASPNDTRGTLSQSGCVSSGRCAAGVGGLASLTNTRRMAFVCIPTPADNTACG